MVDLILVKSLMLTIPHLHVFFPVLPVEHRSYNRVFKISYEILSHPPLLLKSILKFFAKLVLPRKRSFNFTLRFPLKRIPPKSTCVIDSHGTSRQRTVLSTQPQTANISLNTCQEPTINDRLNLSIKCTASQTLSM